VQLTLDCYFTSPQRFLLFPYPLKCLWYALRDKRNTHAAPSTFGPNLRVKSDNAFVHWKLSNTRVKSTEPLSKMPYCRKRSNNLQESWCHWAVRPFTIHWPSWWCSFGSLDVISRTKIRRTARESHENGLWTCPLQQMRLEHFELFFCLTFSISYGSKHIKICAWLANGMLPGRVK